MDFLSGVFLIYRDSLRQKMELLQTNLGANERDGVRVHFSLIGVAIQFITLEADKLLPLEQKKVAEKSLHFQRR